MHRRSIGRSRAAWDVRHRDRELFLALRDDAAATKRREHELSEAQQADVSLA